MQIVAVDTHAWLRVQHSSTCVSYAYNPGSYECRLFENTLGSQVRQYIEGVDVWYTVVPNVHVNDQVRDWFFISDVKVDHEKQSLSNVTSTHECWLLCRQAAADACKAFTYDLSLRKCYLTDSFEIKSSIYLKSNCVSGVRKQSMLMVPPLFDSTKESKWRYEKLGHLTELNRFQVKESDFVNLTRTECFNMCTVSQDCKYVMIRKVHSGYLCALNGFLTYFNTSILDIVPEEEEEEIIGSAFLYEKIEPPEEPSASPAWHFTTFWNFTFVEHDKRAVLGTPQTVADYVYCLGECDKSTNCAKVTFDLERKLCTLYGYAASLVRVPQNSLLVSFVKNLNFESPYLMRVNMELAPNFNNQAKSMHRNLDFSCALSVKKCFEMCSYMTSGGRKCAVVFKYAQQTCEYYEFDRDADLSLVYSNSSDLFVLKDLTELPFEHVRSFSRNYLYTACSDEKEEEERNVTRARRDVVYSDLVELRNLHSRKMPDMRRPRLNQVSPVDENTRAQMTRPRFRSRSRPRSRSLGRRFGRGMNIFSGFLFLAGLGLDIYINRQQREALEQKCNQIIRDLKTYPDIFDEMTRNTVKANYLKQCNIEIKRCKEPPRMANSDFTKSERERCTNKPFGSKCILECKPGYRETPDVVYCTQVDQDTFEWRSIDTPDGDYSCRLENELCESGESPKFRVSTRPFDDIRHRVVAYVGRFSKRRRIPMWTLAYRSLLNDVSVVERNQVFTTCPYSALARFQISNDEYTNYPYDRGHLVPYRQIRYHRKAAKSSFWFVNIAPQSSSINQQQWRMLEGAIETMGKYRMFLFIATGTCPNDVNDPRINSRVSMPSCFWKLVCAVNDKTSMETVAGYYHWNSVQSESTSEQIFTLFDQSQILELLANSEYGDLVDMWDEAALEALRGRRSLNIHLSPRAYMCRNAKKLSNEDREFWTRHINPTTATESFSRLRSMSVSDEDTEDENDNDNEEANRLASCNKKIIGYYTSWGQKVLTDQQARRLSHVIFAFIEMRSDGSLLLGSADRKNAKDADAEARVASERLEHLVKLKERHRHLRVLFAVGGWENSQYFSATVRSPEMTNNFINSALGILERYGLDGVDIDWEYPVTGGAQNGTKDERELYVRFMQHLRDKLTDRQRAKGRSEPYLLTFAGAAGQWTLEPGFDLVRLLDIVDWVNVMTYDYYGAWESKWGAYTGPPAPLYHGTPSQGFSGKMNSDYTLKYYACKTKRPEKIVMGLAFYGRYWHNVGPPLDTSTNDGMWRRAEMDGGRVRGGYLPFYELRDYLRNPLFKVTYHKKSASIYAFNEHDRVFIGFENELTIAERVKYAGSKNLAGVMIWAVDLDDEWLSMLRAIRLNDLCTGHDLVDTIQYKCSPIDERRWWIFEDDLEMATSVPRAGMCGRSAPLYNGFYPVCDPYDQGYSCCSHFGFCTSSINCTCESCIDYSRYPEKILDEPLKPTTSVRWWTLADGQGKAGRCGYEAPKIPTDDGKRLVYAICNPDDSVRHCCSNGGYCGTGNEFCECDGCVDFKKEPDYEYQEVKWWTWSMSQENAGKCGPTAPLLNGKTPICNPRSKSAHCCSSGGYCGTGNEFCECDGCVDLKKEPDYEYQEVKWWTWSMSQENAGKCGPTAPLLNGKIPICNPRSKSAHCCGKWGFCGQGSEYCSCPECVDYSKDL